MGEDYVSDHGVNKKVVCQELSIYENSAVSNGALLIKFLNASFLKNCL